jgi:Protein of unknown function (DUF2806)
MAVPGPLDLSGLTKPATVLVEKVSEAIGGLAKPWQIKRVARAEAAAALIHANVGIEIDDLRRRALVRMLNEEARKQDNIESVIREAIPHLSHDADPSQMDNDWVENLFEKARHVSDETMRQHWAKLLAEEANNPGSFSKNTLNILSNMTGREAQLFRRFSGSFVMFENELPQERLSRPLVTVPVISNINTAMMKKLGLEHDDVVLLQSLSLITIDRNTFCQRYEPTKDLARAIYHHEELNISVDKNREIVIGIVILTRWGLELSTLFEWDYSPKYFEEEIRAKLCAGE